MRNSRRACRFTLSLMLACCSLTPLAARAQSLCVYDPLGAGGEYYSMFQDYQLAAKRWGVNIELQVFGDDIKLDEAFRSGQCDMASMLGMHARSYNAFTGTIDAPGVIENFSQLRDVMAVVASPRLATYMESNGYEVEGVVPVGPSYVLTANRNINSLGKAAGMKAAVMSWDRTQSMMTEYFNITPVPTDLPHYAGLFRDGKVDFIVVPMVLYKALELGRYLGPNGGIVRRPLFQFTMQLVAHADKFPPGFGQKSREFMYAETDHAISLARNMEAEIDNRVWIYAMHSEVMEWNTGMRDVLDHLTRAGVFDRKMLALLARVRCRENSAAAECASAPEQQRTTLHP